MLTDKEKEAAKKAKYFGTGDAWGFVEDDGTLGLWPAGMVAQLRGAKTRTYSGRYTYQLVTFRRDDQSRFQEEELTSMRIAINTLQEIATWLGFSNKEDYLEALGLEQEKIFERLHN